VSKNLATLLRIGGVDVELNSFLTWARGGGQLHPTATLFPVKELLWTVCEAGWTPDTVGEEKNNEPRRPLYWAIPFSRFKIVGHTAWCAFVVRAVDPTSCAWPYCVHSARGQHILDEAGGCTVCAAAYRLVQDEPDVVRCAGFIVLVKQLVRNSVELRRAPVTYCWRL